MEFQEITLADFIQNVLPSVGHNRTQLLSMAVVQEGAVVMKEGREAGRGKDLLYHNVDDHYKITLSSIQAYFAENPRPKQALSVQDENKALKARIEELEKRVGKEKGVTLKPSLGTAPKAEEGDVVKTYSKDEIPPKDENIPAKKLSETDFKSKLREELKGVKSPSVKAITSVKKKDIPKGN